MRTCFIEQGTLLRALWWPKWKEIQNRGGPCTHIADSLQLHSRNQDNIVKWESTGKCELLSHAQLFVIPQTVAHQALLSMGILQERILGWVAMPSSRESSQPKDQTQVFCIAGKLFTIWTTRKPKNTGVGSLYLLQGNFLIQKLNQGLLHCRWILYQLSYQGSTVINMT